MRIVISGIPIDVQKKNIKNMHLQVKPPDGHVVISAPLSVDDKARGLCQNSAGLYQEGYCAVSGTAKGIEASVCFR